MFPFRHRTPALVLLLGSALGIPQLLQAQFETKLSPKTVAAFDSYVGAAQSELNERWSGRKSFLALDERPADRKDVLGGKVSIEQLTTGGKGLVPQGLIHDWRGAIYIPNTSIEQVVHLLEDFDRHAKIYPAVSKSKLVSKNGDDVTGRWRLQQHAAMVPIILDVEERVSYSPVTSGKWKGTAVATTITEINRGLLGGEKPFPVGEGHGFMWRLNSYWSLETAANGVLAECRTISLSRDVPSGVGWAVAPYLEKTPHDSLQSTLVETRKALTGR